MRDAVAPIPRVLLVSRTRYRFPLDGAAARKFAALGEVMTWRMLARGGGPGGDGRMRLLARFPAAALDGLVFNLRLPFTLARELRRTQPDAVVAQDPFAGLAALIARRLAGKKVPVVVEVHGDWRTATRLYGGRVRRLLAVPGDAAARVALRRADAVRAISNYTAGLAAGVRGSVDAQFPTFLDLAPCTALPLAPLPEGQVALFVGVLERYKNIDGLLAAWKRVHRRLPAARLRIVGTGSLEREILRAIALDDSIEYRASLTRDGVVAALDGSTCLVLPSRSEGMGRIVVEALARGRPVVASMVGGLPELVHDGVNGALVDPDDPDAIADALVALLQDRELAARLGANGAAWASTLDTRPTRFAQLLRDLVDVARGPVELPAADDVDELRDAWAGSSSGRALRT